MKLLETLFSILLVLLALQGVSVFSSGNDIPTTLTEGETVISSTGRPDNATSTNNSLEEALGNSSTETTPSARDRQAGCEDGGVSPIYWWLTMGLAAATGLLLVINVVVLVCLCCRGWKCPCYEPPDNYTFDVSSPAIPEAPAIPEGERGPRPKPANPPLAFPSELA